MNIRLKIYIFRVTWIPKAKKEMFFDTFTARRVSSFTLFYSCSIPYLISSFSKHLVCLFVLCHQSFGNCDDIIIRKFICDNLLFLYLFITGICGFSSFSVVRFFASSSSSIAVLSPGSRSSFKKSSNSTGGAA